MKLRSGLVFVMMLESFLSGCLAYRISGFSSTTYGVEAEPHSGQKYRIREFRVGFDTSDTEGKGSLVIPKIAKMPREQVVAAIAAKQPSWFSSSSDAVPVDVELRLRSTRTENDWSVLVYMFSAGILPLWMDFISENDIMVKVQGVNETGRSASLPLKLMYSYSLSCWTPLGGIPYRPVPTSISDVTRSPAFPGPSNDEVLNAFADSAAKVIVRAIDKAVQKQGERRMTNGPTAKETPVVAKEVVVEKVEPTVRERDEETQFGEAPSKCPVCGAIKDKNGKCPLCDN